MKFAVTWEFASRYEERRTSLVTANSATEAKRKIERDHIDPESALRNAIEFIRVAPSNQPVGRSLQAETDMPIPRRRLQNDHRA